MEVTLTSNFHTYLGDLQFGVHRFFYLDLSRVLKKKTKHDTPLAFIVPYFGKWV